MKTSCAFYRESLSDTGSLVIADCKALTHIDCDNCKFYKTWDAYNSKKVENDIQLYREEHGA